MLNYLRIFSWLLLSFGVIGFLAVAAGLAPDVGPVPAALGVMATQSIVASAIVYGFKLHGTGQLSRNTLLYGGWALVVILIVTGQIWVNASGINI